MSPSSNAKAELRRQPFERASLEDVLAFCGSWPVHPHHSGALIEKFLTSFASGPELVFDFFLGSERVACAVLLDRVDNPGNNACLEVIGLRPGDHAPAVYERLLEEVKRSLPAHRAGIEACLHPDSPVGEQTFSERGFSPAYWLFHMEKPSPTHERVEAPEGYRWRTFEVSDLPALHPVLLEVFAQNRETSVPDLETMSRALAGGVKDKNPYVLLLKGRRIVGFTKVAFQAADSAEEPARGEVSLVGVSPSERGRGLGRVALSKALQELEHQGAKQFMLTVAASNERALRLYQDMGFSVKERSLCLWYRPVL